MPQSINRFKANTPHYSYLGHFRDPKILEAGHNISGYDENVPKAQPQVREMAEANQDSRKGFERAFNAATDLKEQVEKVTTRAKAIKGNYSGTRGGY